METPWHQLTAAEVIKELGTSRDGLSLQEVELRQQQYGLNKIPEQKPKTLLQIFLSQFLSPLIYVLMGAAIVSVAVGDAGDALFILTIIVINATLGTWQESKAEQNALALRNLVKIKSRVKREDTIYEVDAEQLVPGDLVLLESGMKVPCDMRLIDVNDLAVEEALLTGESLPVLKENKTLHTAVQTIGDRLNMAFAATTITRGRAWGIATGTGIHTEIGKIANSLATSEVEKPPLLKRMDQFARTISQAVLIVCFLLGIIGLWQGMKLMEVFFFMIAVAVSAIPEGLPVALTVALAVGTSRMAKRHVIVRKLAAVEGLGSCTMIASDKTGTLTLDQQSVCFLVLPNGQQLEVSGQGYNGNGEFLLQGAHLPVSSNSLLLRLIQAAVLCNEATLRKTKDDWEHSGDAVDVALLALAYKAGLAPRELQQQVEIVKNIPYESENKFAGVFYKEQDQLQFVMKGAVEVIIPKLSDSDKSFLKEAANQLAEEGYRVIALAGTTVADMNLERAPELRLIGVAGLIDPLREEVIGAINACQKAGIEVAMVTGDHPKTALAIAKQLGLAFSEDEVITGQELADIKLNQPELFNQKVLGKHVFARVTPLQKKEIVDALKANNHFVAVTGDGANDAPALKAAHIGIAMGSGTDLTKETSSLIITDNNFASIAAGVEEGRFTFNNLRNIIYLLISTGAAEILLVALTLIFGMPLPFIPVQLLWLNLVTNGVQDVSLAFEKGDAAVMQKSPRKPEEGIFDRIMVQQILISAVTITALTFGLWYILVELQQMNVVHARTDVMMLMVLIQNFHVLNCRSETKSFLQIPIQNNYFLLGGILFAQLVHIGASYVSFLSDILQLEPIAFSEWIRLVPTAILILVVMEVFKGLKRKSLI